MTPGTRLGSYEILSRIGAGGMGEVYRAIDTRLEREARTVASLNHPNIVTLFSVEDVDGVRFLTMKLVTGESLDRQVVPGGLPVERVPALGRRAGGGHAALHGTGASPR